MRRRSLAWGLIAALGLALAGSLQADPPTAAISQGSRTLQRPAPSSRGARFNGPASGWNGLGGTLALFGAAAGVAWVAQRWNRRDVAGPGALQVVDRIQLTSRHALHVVRAGDRLFLLGTGTAGAPALLGELPSDDPRRAPTPTTQEARPDAGKA